MNDTISTIRSRRSVRKFSSEEIQNGLINSILEAGRWAPSGLNNQPWRFCVIRDGKMRESLAALTEYGGIILSCGACIAVMYHRPSGYNREKDIMSIGACIQNMLLAAASLGMGAVWLGEILNRKNEAGRLLGAGDDYELMAVIAMGWPDESPVGERMPLENLVVKRF